MQQNKSMPEGMKKGRSAAGGFLVFLSCEGDAVLKRQLGVHQGFEVALLTWTWVSATSQGAESLMSGPSGLRFCHRVCVCGEGSSTAPWAVRGVHGGWSLSPHAARRLLLLTGATPSSTALHRLSALIQPDGHSKGCFTLSLCSSFLSSGTDFLKSLSELLPCDGRHRKDQLKPSTLREHVL